MKKLGYFALSILISHCLSINLFANTEPVFSGASAKSADVNKIVKNNLKATGLIPGDASPNQPVVLQPLDNANGVPVQPTLQVTVSDPDPSDNIDVSFYGRPTATSPGADFSMVLIPDPQNESQFYPAVFTSMTDWIVSQKNARNIVFVTALGDMVNNASSLTEYGNADAAMDKLDPAAIPYSIGVGNHDQPTTNFNAYFGISRFSGKPWYGGHYGSNNDNSYSLFTASGMEFILINLEYNPSGAILDWADALLKANPGRRAIVESHSILNLDNSWSIMGIYTALKDNPNLFLMICGHMNTPSDGAAYRSEIGDDGHTIHIMLADYQGFPNGGNGYLRILRFSPAEDKIYATTYSPYINQSITSTTNYDQMEITYDMPNGTPEPYTLVGTVNNVANGGMASLSWPELEVNTEYEWYVTVSDGVGTVTGPTWSFTTGNTQPPTAFNVTGGGSYCQGASGLPVGLSDSEAGVTYTLYRNSVAQSPAVAGSGTSISFGNRTAGTYTVNGTNGSGTTTMSGSALILENSGPAAPVVNLTQPACGSATGTITVTAPTGTGMTYSINGSTYTNTSGIFTAATGTYNVTARNASGCTSPATGVTLNANPQPAAPTINLTQPVCGSATGTITVTAPTGTGMTYSINGSTYTNTSGIFTAATGTYNVTARNASGCTSSATSVTLNSNPLPAAPTVNLTQPACGSATGTITITAPSGTGMTYSINGSTYTNTSGIFTAATGTYNVTARNASGCTSSGTSVTLNANPLPAAPTISLSQPACGPTTGTITVTAPTGTGMTYSINGSTYTNTSGIFTSVATGTYNVTSRNSLGCTSSATGVTLNVNPLPAAPTVSLSQPACGSTIGTITVTAPTGTGMTYSINGSTYTNTSGIFTVATGTYNVTARNASGCTSSGTGVTLNSNPLPAAPTISLTQPSCGSTTGTITVTAPTGSGMTYSINGSTYTNTSGIFTSVGIGTYNVTARNASGCTSSGTSVTLNANPLPAAPTISLSQPACGSTTGTITVTAPTGTGMTYSINGSTYTNTTGIFTSVATGTYNVTARNVSGCTSSGTSVTLNANPLPAAPTISLTQPACGSTTGTITVTAPTGTGMTYSINGSTYTNTSGIFTAVTGTYNVTARNATGCTSSGTSVTLNANPLPAAPTVSLSQPVCGSATGTITVTAPTGSGMTYSINGSTYTNTSGIFTAVTGTYNVTARNATGCTSSGTSVTLNANPLPAAPTVSLSQPVCGSATGTITVTAPTGSGMTYSINGSTYTNTSGIFTSVGIGTYNVTARNATGCTSSATGVTLNANPQPAAPTVSLSQPSCGSTTGTITVTAPTGSGMTYSINGSTYTNTSGIFTSVATGTYNVTARNASGCTSPGTGVTLNSNPIPAAPTVSLSPPACGLTTGTITVTAPTGTGMTYSINGSTYTNTSGIFTAATGTYNVTARNASGCTSPVTSVTLSANPLPAAPTVSLTQPACGSTTGTITVTAPTGTGMTYSINGSTYTNTSGIFTSVSTGTYNVTARNASGCTSTGIGVTLNANPKPVTPIITSDGNILHSDATNGNQWYNESLMINGATTQDYTATSDGEYYVIVTAASCISNPSNIINLVVTTIEQVENGKDIVLYPNPTDGKVTLRFSAENPGRVVIEVLNMKGQTVRIEKSEVSENQMEIDLEMLPEGIYFIRINSSGNSIIKTVILK